MEAGASGQKVLQLRAVLRGISPLIWRRLLVRGDTSVARLHKILQVAFGWQDMHLHRFEIRGREYGVHQEGGVFFDTDAHEVSVRLSHLAPVAAPSEDGVHLFWRTPMHPNSSSHRVHSAEFKARIPAECRQPGASVSAVAIAHGLNTNVVRKWLTGRGLKRMNDAVPAAGGTAPPLQFVPVESPRSEPVVAAPTSQADIRIELQRGGLHVKLQCAASAGALYAAQLP